MEKKVEISNGRTNKPQEEKKTLISHFKCVTQPKYIQIEYTLTNLMWNSSSIIVISDLDILCRERNIKLKGKKLWRFLQSNPSSSLSSSSTPWTTTARIRSYIHCHPFGHDLSVQKSNSPHGFHRQMQTSQL